MDPNWICLKCGECHVSYAREVCEKCGWRRPLDKEKLKMLKSVKGKIRDE